jgi:hypothetical protein
VRELVDLGGIARKSLKGIKENEHLQFVALPERQLFG